MNYNIYREQFPNVILAGMFGFTPAQQFVIEDEAERAAPKVEF